jgi:hypothetical protein
MRNSLNFDRGSSSAEADSTFSIKVLALPDELVASTSGFRRFLHLRQAAYALLAFRQTFPRWPTETNSEFNRTLHRLPSPGMMPDILRIFLPARLRTPG